MGKLTDLLIKSVQAGPRDLQLSDGGGLVLRVGRGSNEKSFYYRYKCGNSSKWLRLGPYPAVSLKEARILASAIDLKRKQGVDPIKEREQEAARAKEEQAEAARLQAAESQRISVHELFRRWAEVDLVRRKDGGSEVKRMFSKDVLPIIGDLAVEDVRKGHITGVTDALLARGVTRMAKSVFSLMRQMFRFAVDRDIIEFDPSAAIRKAKIGGKDTERDRVLSDDEIRSLARQIPDANLSTQAESAVWIALATCCRIGELLSSKWADVDLEQRKWRITPEQSKNGKSHTIHLSDFSLSQFKILKSHSDNMLSVARDVDPSAKPPVWIFPNRQRDGSVCSKTITKQLGDRQRMGKEPMKGRARADIAGSLLLAGGKWGPHDLRRTGATIMVKLGVLPEVAERCLNHTEQNKVKRIYQRHSYEVEMQEAWTILGKRLESLLDHPGPPSAN